MVEWYGNQISALLPLLGEWAAHPIVRACLEGNMGRAWVDNPVLPRSGRIITGDFCFLFGKGNVAILEGLSAFPSSLLVLPQSAEWEKILLSAFPHANRFTRFAFGKPVFNRNALEGLQPPPGFSIAEIDEPLYARILALPWAKDLCALFSSCEQFRRHGLGFVALYGDEIVAGASSYVFCDGAIEIEVDTSPPFRRRGLAAACCSRLILTCLGRGILPHWDAANPASASLAQKLGYPFLYEYPAYHMR